jgi:hypothetical protein
VSCHAAISPANPAPTTTTFTPTSGAKHGYGQRVTAGSEMILSMGYDDIYQAEWEQGWHASDKFICPSCVGDAFLKNIVAKAARHQDECSFCAARPAAPFDTFMAAVMVGIDNRFEQADNAGMPWDGGYVFDTYDQDEVADQFSWVAAGPYEGNVFEELCHRLAEKTYASRWWLESEPDEAYSSAWKDFQQQIMHRTRFVFWATQVDADRYKGAGDVPVAQVLQAIGALLVKFDRVKPLESGTVTYRARGHTAPEGSQGWRATDLGTNLPERTTSSSRMSPAGIPLFYGADDTDTALAEVSHADRSEFFTVGRFTTTAPMTVIDLTDVPTVPSVFDPALGGLQGHLLFLNDLVEELRKPVEPDRSALDYIPTQVFCEYFLRVFTHAGIPVHGLAWRSAASPDSARCLALDIPQQDCVDAAHPATEQIQLRLAADSVTVYQRQDGGFRQVSGN